MTSQDGSLRRRTLLKMATAAGLVAGCSPKPAPEKLVSYLVPPDDLAPGQPLFYRTVCRECPAGCGVTARSREGRIIKLEGNPEDPIGRGALCARGQSAVQRLYSPDRLRGPMRRGADGALSPIGWDEAEKLLAAALAAARDKAHDGSVRMLSRSEPGSAGALARAFLEVAGAAPAHRVVLEPLDPSPLRAASAALYGRAELPVYDLSAARLVVSFGADFLETWLSPVELSRGFAAGRARPGDDRTRLVWVGPRLSLTGAMADGWVEAPTGGELAVALGLLRWLTDPASGVSGLSPDAAQVFKLVASLEPGAIERASGISWARIAGLGKELAERRPSALLGPGAGASGPDATELATAVGLLDWVLGNVGRTVRYGLDPLADTPSPLSALEALFADLTAGKVAVLLVHHADPIGALPGAFGAAAALGKVPLVVSFSDHLDATTALAHLILPDNHPLESFGDVTPRRGVITLAQPAMQPLADTRATSQVLLEVAAKLPPPAARLPYEGFYAFTRSRDPRPAAGEDAEVARRRAQQRGGYYDDVAAVAVTPAFDKLPPFAVAPPAPPAAGELALLVFPTALRYDGRSDTSWLREIPDALSGIAWSSWVELGPSTAAQLGIADGDVLELSAAGRRTELPAAIHPGLREGAVAIPLGSAEPLALLPALRDARGGGIAWAGASARVTRTGRNVRLPRTETHPFQDGSHVVRTVGDHARALPQLPPPPGMTPPPDHPVHRWAMSIDLDQCSGCQACVVACYAENNVPVVGAEAISLGRSMAWLTIQRYATREEDGLRIDAVPVLCQQCDSAPCETVCPVYATYHTKEGLNAQVYNRCIGTRYCANNCPYKARAFNWQDPQFPSPLDLQLNPDVSVRSRGVMEKCTFCVQRIRVAENTARDEHRPVADGDVVPACAATCPTQAIVFGDALDPGSRIARLRESERGYRLLEDLNTRPAVTYLARVRRSPS